MSSEHDIIQVQIYVEDVISNDIFISFKSLELLIETYLEPCQTSEIELLAQIVILLSLHTVCFGGNTHIVKNF